MPENPDLGALEDLPRALTRLVEKSGRQQKDIAPRIGVTPSSLSRILTGRNRPTVETLGNLLQELHCTVWDLAAALDEAAGRKSPQSLDSPLLVAVLPLAQLLQGMAGPSTGSAHEAFVQAVRTAVEQHLTAKPKQGGSTTDDTPE